MKRCLACLMSIVLAVGLLPTAAWGVGLRAAEAGGPDAVAGDGGGDGGGAAAEWTPAPTTDEARALESMSDDFAVTRIGAGGLGALFHPVISPFDHDTMVASCDMGGLYVTHDAGSNWKTFNCNGRVFATAADPGRAGVFYAGGSGLWRTEDNGDSWEMIWPKRDDIEYVQSKLNHARTYYFMRAPDSGSDPYAYPDANAVEAVCVDAGDSKHIAALCSAGTGGSTGTRTLCESFDGGESFQVSARFAVDKKPKDTTFENTRVFIEPAASGATARESRVVAAVPDGLFALDRSAKETDSAMPLLYEAPATIQDAAQVLEGGKAHYVVLENRADADAVDEVSRVKLWHSDFSSETAAIDLTGELVASLPRLYNSKKGGDGADYEISKHNAVTLCAPSLDRIYLGYRSRDLTNPSGESWQGVSGLVTYDASRAEGARFEWTYGHRCYWNRDDKDKRVAANQNHLMARAHIDANFTMLGMAADPRDGKRIVLTTHTGLFYSPDIDADVGTVDHERKINLYPRYSVVCEENKDNDGRAANLNEYRMRSTGLEVSVAEHVRTDPFDENHVMLCQDDAGCYHSYDGGETWSRFYTRLPKVGDCCFDAVFDEGREGVVYGAWDAKGAAAYNPSARFYEGKSVFARSSDGGISWDEAYSKGLPDNAAVVKIAVCYPRDASGEVTDGERTIYVATMGYGFYVSHDSGRTFKPMNAGVAAVAYTTGDVTYQSIWARDLLLTEDGRIFGMTQYSSLGNTTSHSSQDERTFGNVWEWDDRAGGGAGAWVKLPFNYAGAHREDSVDVRQPRSFAYDAQMSTLYVAAVSVVGSWPTPVRWNNFGGGLYAYTCDAADAVGTGKVERLDAPTSPDTCGENLAAIGFDVAGRTWLATEDGDVYYHEGRGAASDEAPWTQVFANTLRLCQGFDFDADGDVYLDTHGVSAIRIRPKPDLAPAKVTLKKSNVTYNGTAQAPVVKSVTLDGEVLVEGTDYTVVPFAARTAAGEYAVTVQSEGRFRGSASTTFKISAKPATPKVTLSATSYVYAGKARKPSVTVRVGSKKLPASAYDVTYATGRKNVGKYSVKVKLKGNYSGSKTATFKILPKGTKLSKVTAGKRAFTAKWKKQTAQVDGYQLQYAANAKLAGAKKASVKKAKTSAKKVSNLKAGKRYYVRIRTFKKASGTTYYSAWSPVKSVTVKSVKR